MHSLSFSQRLSEDFLDKKLDCDEFLDQYIEKRTQTHLLKIKSEKLGEMMVNHTTTGTWGGSGGAGTVQQTYGNTNTAGSHPPYPMYSSTHMPTPVMPPVSG